jgi:uncharacterized membrane protein YbhN (UPF0104 family)
MSLTVPVGVRRAWPRLRLLAGAVVLVALVWRFGTGPFADAWHGTTWSAVAAVLAINLASTLTSAWRWRVVARELGAPLTVRESVTSYYRSQVLNSALPGGILGDAHRGVRHGRGAGNLAVGLRATAWERLAGQVVQVGMMVLALAFLGTSLTPLTPLALFLVGVPAAAAWLLARSRAAIMGWVSTDLRVLARPPVGARLTLASCGSSLGHVAVFLVAAHAVGVQASWPLLATVALVVLVGSAVPLNVAGWGPREGVTAWVFAAVGLGAATGLTVSIVYGVLGAVATAPGALVLLADALGRGSRPGTALETPDRPLEEAPCG